MIGIGIDTGGTYTDAVIYDLQSEVVLGRGKAPTTHQKLETGIENALDALPVTLLHTAEFLSLSTTLATNACVEEVGGRAKLILLGVRYETVEEMYIKYGLPSPKEILFFNPNDESWEDGLRSSLYELDNYDSVAVVQIFPQKDGGKHEKTASKIIGEYSDITCICGSELFQERNVLRRAAGAILNAQLIPVIKNFINEVKCVLKKKNIDIPIIIVRSDGSVMSLNFAKRHPIETLLCGPAASVMAGLKLARENDALIVDMGGTTTDIAVVEEGIPVLEPSGISIGKWKTFVKGLYVETFGLGGDSAVRFENRKVYIDNKRVVPLCVLADKYPEVYDELEDLISTTNGNDIHFLHEFYLLLHDIEDTDGYSDREHRLCRALKDGPLILSKAAVSCSCDPYTLNTTRLEKEGIVIRCGLTPTDIMHIKGDFNRYDNKASKLAAKYFSLCTDYSQEKLCNKVYDLVEEKLYCNIVKLLWKREVPSKNDKEDKIWDEAVKLSYKMAKCDTLGMCKMSFKTKAAFIGIGAPIHIFLERVAKLLGTKVVIPEEAPQANALGAVLGNVTASYKMEINLNYENGNEGYVISDTNDFFETYEEARTSAENIVRSHVENIMLLKGAGNYTVRITSKQIRPVIDGKEVFYGEILTATAAGKPDFLNGLLNK